MIKKIANHFLIGVLSVLPFVVIIEVTLLVKDVIESFVKHIYRFSDNVSVTLVMFGLCFILLVSMGASMSRYGRSIVIVVCDWIAYKIPVLSSIYKVTQKTVALFSGQGAAAKKEVVLIEYPKQDVWVPAYVTNKDNENYVLFVPTSPNPTSGFTVIIHASKIRKVDMSLEDVTRFIVSVGVDFDMAHAKAKGVL